MIDEAKRQWNAGSIVTLTLHVCSPNLGETCNWDTGVQNTLSDSQWTSLITSGRDLNRRWKRRLDNYASFLRQLQDEEVVVLLRPFHEINGGWFWWGNRPGPNGSLKLFQITHQYLTSLGLKNLLWVWNAADQADTGRLGDFYPGDNYVDILSLDVWDPNSLQPKENDYERMLQLANGKPIALGEVGQLPYPATLEKQDKWIWFMCWADYLRNPDYNTDQGVRDTYSLDRTLKQGELDGIPTGNKRERTSTTRRPLFPIRVLN